METTSCDQIAELMENIALYQDGETKEERQIANAALEQLLSSQKKILYGLIHKATDFESFHFDPDDLFYKLAQKIWVYAEKFNPNPQDNIRKQFVGWAAVILKNIIADIWRKVQIENENISYLAESLRELQNKESNSDTRIEIIEKALEELNEDDQEILRLTAQYIPLDGGQLRIPKEERQQLCLHLGITETNLRKKRSRAFESFKKAIEGLT